MGVFEAYRGLRNGTVDSARLLLAVLTRESILENFDTWKRKDEVHRSEAINAANAFLEDFRNSGIDTFDPLRIAGFFPDENRLSNAFAAVLELDKEQIDGLGRKSLIELLGVLIERDPKKIGPIRDLLRDEKVQYKVHREYYQGITRPDIAILSAEFAIIVENKIRGGSETFIRDEFQTDRQWQKLQEYGLANKIPEEHLLGLLLSPEGVSPSSSAFIRVSKTDLTSAMFRAVGEPTESEALSGLRALLHYYDRV
jgi:hypothetical protein